MLFYSNCRLLCGIFMHKSEVDVVASKDDIWTREEVLQSLDAVLASPAFAASQQLQSFLTYVVVQTLDGNADRLKAYTIAVDALRKPEAFDPQIDPTVRVLAGKLRSALRLYYATEGSQDPIRFDMPKGSYRTEFISKIDELTNHTNDGIAIEQARSGRWWAMPTVIGLLAMVAAVGFRLYFVQQTPDDHKPHAPIIAVAAFENISGESSLDDFKSGLRFDLVSELSRFSWISTYAAKEHTQDHNHSPFHADYILRGSLTAANKRIHVSYRLESADTGIVKWAQVFDRELTSQNIFEIQKETVQAIAFQIGNPAGILNQLEQDRYQQNVGGLNAYLCALKLYDYWRTFARDKHLEIRTCLETAIITDPGYAEAHAALAFIYLHEELLGSNRRTGYDPLKRALAEASIAAGLDKFSILAKRALYTTLLFNGDLEEFSRIGHDAVRVNPNNPELLSDFGHRLAVNAGKWEEGIDFSKKALSLNPNPPPSYFIALALQAISKGENYWEVLQWTERMNSTDFPFFYMITAIAHSELKHLAAAQASLAALGIQSATMATQTVRKYRMHKPFETLIIQRLNDAYKYAANTS